MFQNQILISFSFNLFYIVCTGLYEQYKLLNISSPLLDQIDYCSFCIEADWDFGLENTINIYDNKEVAFFKILVLSGNLFLEKTFYNHFL